MELKESEAPSNTEKKTDELTPIPKLENYVDPLTIDDLNKLEEIFELVLKNFQKKMETPNSNNLILKHKETQIKNKDLVSLLKEKNSLSEINDAEKFDLIIDVINFYYFRKVEDSLKEIQKKEIDQNTLNKLFNINLTEKGTLILLGDYHYLCNLTQSFKKLFGNIFKNKLFIKLYSISNLPFIGIFSIQKMSQSKEIINIENEKLLFYKVNEDFTIEKPISFTMGQLSKSITYLSEIYQYHEYLKDLHKGQSNPIKIKENYWSDNIDFTITVVDSKDDELLKLKKCAAIIITKNFSNDFITLTFEGNMSLCKEANVSRILVVRSAPFNFDSATIIKEKLQNYIRLFSFKDCVDKSIPIMITADDNNDNENVFMDDKILVRDVKEKVDNNEITLRQLIFRSNPYEIQCEVKILLTSKKKLQKEKNKYVPIYTIEKYSSKNLVQCFDDSYLSMFYIQALLSSICFLNLNNFPENSLKILILGAGIGTINYYFNKILKENVIIDAVELDKEVAEVGLKYFGLNNFQNEKNKNIKWYFEDAKKFIEEKNVKDYYDVIVMDINNTNSIQGISPPLLFFEQNILDKINDMLNKDGVYIINLMARSYQNYKKAYYTLDNKFPHILNINNNEDLNKIHFCFKTKKTKDEYFKFYNTNLSKLSNKEIADISDTEQIFRLLLPRFVLASEQKVKLESY